MLIKKETAMQSVRCKIVENDRLIKDITIKTKEDMFFSFEFFAGKRNIDIEQQYIDLLNSSHSKNEQVYELNCSYFKFGQMEQEKKILTVMLSK